MNSLSLCTLIKTFLTHLLIHIYQEKKVESKVELLYIVKHTANGITG
jgi:hypothetical protein